MFPPHQSKTLSGPKSNRGGFQNTADRKQKCGCGSGPQTAALPFLGEVPELTQCLISCWNPSLVIIGLIFTNYCYVSPPQLWLDIPGHTVEQKICYRRNNWILIVIIKFLYLNYQLWEQIDFILMQNNHLWWNRSIVVFSGVCFSNRQLDWQPWLWCSQASRTALYPIKLLYLQLVSINTGGLIIQSEDRLIFR